MYSSLSPAAVQATDDPSNVLCYSPRVSQAPPSQLTFPRPTSLVPGNRRSREAKHLTHEFGQPEEYDISNFIFYHVQLRYSTDFLSLVWPMYSLDI